MKFKTLQILWHERQPVFAVEFLSSDVLATGGADKAIRTWKVSASRSRGATGNAVSKVRKSEVTGVGVLLESELTGISGSVNCIRRSPKCLPLSHTKKNDQRDAAGEETFASGGDHGELIVWRRHPGWEEESEEASQGKMWKPSAFLRGHANDVFDMSWSSDGTSLVTASLEGVTIVWDVQRERPKVRLCEHDHYVQGVACDPLNQFLVTQGGDRRCKIYTRPAEAHAKLETSAKTASQWRVSRTLFKTQIAPQQGSGLEISHTFHKHVTGESSQEEAGARDFLFHDDTLSSFFRRLAWSPEGTGAVVTAGEPWSGPGSFLVIPAGVRRLSSDSQAFSHVAYVYSRGKWSTPVACLPGGGEPFVAVRFCPVLFEKDSGGEENSFTDLPYAVIFACATLHNILVYSTQSLTPLALLCGLHYSEITDLAWSPDGTCLFISSRDGYCSVVQFEEGDLGMPLNLEQLTSADPTASSWFHSLEEIQNRVDLLPAKRQICQSHKPTSEDSLQRSTAEKTKPRVRRRITPVVVDPQNSSDSKAPQVEETTEKIVELVSSSHSHGQTLLSDLHRLAGDSQPIAKESEEPAKKRSLADLLAMSQSYVKDRFGN